MGWVIYFKFLMKIESGKRWRQFGVPYSAISTGICQKQGIQSFPANNFLTLICGNGKFALPRFTINPPNNKHSWT
jgi:hypothetical protein